MKPRDQRLTGIVALLLLGACGSSCRNVPTPAVAANTYVDARQCRSCHASIAGTYSSVGMARAFAAVSDLREATADASVVHVDSGRHYQVIHREGRTFQRRFEVDGAGRESNAYELEATHVVGSGNHARTWLHRSASGEFTELPLTWYSQEQRWALSPGFEGKTPPDFTRIVDNRCLFCHNGYPDASGTLSSGIDCQRCHGPGSRHIELASGGKAAKAEIAGAIVNPAKLTPERQLDVCMQCHLETTSAPLPSSIRRFDRDVFSFRPGEPLGSYAVTFDNAQPDKFEIVNQAYRMRQSACFLKSGGRLTCTTCHNPHAVKRGAEARADFSAKCRTCHASVAAPKHPPLVSADCITCHMPARRTEDAVHVTMTDHRIQRRPSPGGKTQRVVGTPALYYPTDLTGTERNLYTGVALVVNGTGRREGIAALEKSTAEAPAKPLAVLGEAYSAEGELAKAIATLRQALAKDPHLAKTRYNLAQTLERSGNPGEAQREYEEALRQQPGFPEAEYAFANMLMQAGNREAAAAHYEAAIRLRPTYAEAWSNLGALSGDQSKLEQALRIDPALGEAHVSLGQLLASQGRVPEALVHMRRAVGLNDRNPVAYYNLARLQQATDDTRGAVASYGRALTLKPDFAEAHLGLGQLLGDSGRLAQAAAEFREVLRLHPGHAEAQRNLEMVSAMLQGRGR